MLLTIYITRYTFHAFINRLGKIKGKVTVKLSMLIALARLRHISAHLSSSHAYGGSRTRFHIKVFCHIFPEKKKIVPYNLQ